ncbi:MAG: hypothetical protein AAFZ09_09465 [Pseudomonadota bacterium]
MTRTIVTRGMTAADRRRLRAQVARPFGMAAAALFAAAARRILETFRAARRPAVARG